MRCPYCRTPLTEHSAECPSCRLTLDRAASLLGPVPRMTPVVGDLAGVFRQRGKKKLRQAINRLEWNFPQVHFHILAHAFSSEHPFDLNVFWFFNCGALSGEHEKAGKNHTVLLALDPIQSKSSIMVGYGLEPFLSAEALDHILELAGPAWSKRDWIRGTLEVIEGIERLLESSAISVAVGFGLSPLVIAPSRDY
ncbi:MAG: hypothetical protein JWO82_1289 [Akkermansiaceae bacterium]|nr:hypothetical protein [Akkermansiaceae bacterium]